MSVEQWARVKELCAAALARAPHERAAYLEEACSENKSLMQEVRSLLSFEAQAQKLLEAPPAEFLAAALGSDASLTGLRIGSYLVGSLLGHGGMGEVYLAEDTDLRRKVALKVLPKEFTNDEQRLQRFKQEARAASGLKHRNIITIYSVGQAGDVYFIATEYVSGPTLRQRLAASGQMELREALNVGMQVASALEAAHRAGIVHRDVKPENIMFEPDGTAKLLDFGIAKLTEDLNVEVVTAGPLKTEQGVVLGTPAYMSPEQARHQALDCRSDLFSLGVVLYEMITGRIPFTGETPYDQQAAVLAAEPTPVQHYLGRVIPELQWVISKALTKEPRRRYQTATDMLVDLQLLDRTLESVEFRRADDEPDKAKRAAAPTDADVTADGKIPKDDWWRRLSRSRLAALGLLMMLSLAVTVLWLTAPGRRLAGLLGLHGPPPVIESIVPSQPVDIIGDQPIEVRGHNFQDELKIKVEFPNGGSGELSGAQIRKSDGNSTSLNVLIDLNGNPGTYSFQVLNPDGQVSPRFTFEARHETQRPAISWISPAAPKTGGGEQPVAVYGHNFQNGLRVEVIQPNGETSELKDRQITNRTANSFQALFFFYVPGKHSIRVVNPNGGKSEYFDIFAQ